MDLRALRRKAGTAALLGFRVAPGPLKRLLVRAGTPNYTVGAVCVLEHEGEVLLLWQPHRRGWSLPGGLLQRGEEPAEAVVREVREEVGLDIDPGDPVTVGVHQMTQSVDVVFRVLVEGDRPGARLAHEARKARWCSLGELREVDLETRQILALLGAALAGSCPTAGRCIRPRAQGRGPKRRPAVGRPHHLAPHQAGSVGEVSTAAITPDCSLRYAVGAGLAVAVLVVTGCSAGPERAGQATVTDAGAGTATGTGASTASATATGTGTAITTATPPPDAAATTTATPPPEALELPRGGTELFPRFRLFGYSGAPGSEGLGRLGIGDLDERVEEMQERGEEFAGDREVMPVLELIATVVHPVPGADGMYRTHVDEEVVQDHLDAARRHDGILLLNIQPGRADFIDEVRYWEDWLVEPDVGVALDPEWAVEEGQVPGRVYGRTSGEELDEVAAYLSDLVQEHNLPEKVMVYHQVHTSVVEDEDDIEPHEGVIIIKSVDGIGHPTDKVGTYNRVNEDKPEHVVAGFKLFYEEDAEFGPLMTGEQVLELDPQPEYILFE